MSDATNITFPVILERPIGGEAVATVVLRDLHTTLGVGRDFNTWVKDRIAKYGFVEGTDYVTTLLPNFGEKGQGRDLKEYFGTLDMAKELAMVENNEAGRKTRQHFIKCERELRQGRVVEASVIKSLVVDLTDLRQQIESLREEKLAARRLANGAVSAVGFKYALQVAEDHGVPQKGRGMLVPRIAQSLLRFCKERGWNHTEEFREDGARRRRLFAIEAVKAWLCEEGHAMIAAHLAGLPFVRRSDPSQSVLRLVTETRNDR